MMSEPQRYLFDLLKELRCLRIEQLELLLAARYGSTPAQVQAMLRQLRYGRQAVHFPGPGLVSYEQCRIEPLLLEAIDVMLEVSKGQILACYAADDSLLLRFLAGEEAKSFSVAAGITPLLRSYRFQPGETLFILSSPPGGAEQGLQVEHYYAVASDDGSHRFFIGAQQKK